MSFFNKILKSFLGDKNQRDLKEVGKIVAKIKKVEPAIKELSDDELRGKSREFKEKIKIHNLILKHKELNLLWKMDT